MGVSPHQAVRKAEDVCGNLVVVLIEITPSVLRPAFGWPKSAGATFRRLLRG